MEKSEVAKAILAYLADHPDAQDTLEGIAHWWLLERQISYHLALVQEAVEDLVQQGLILENRSTGSQPGYRLNLDRLEEIQSVFRKSKTLTRDRRPPNRKSRQ